MSETDKRDRSHFRRAEDAERAVSQDARLAEYAMALLGCKTADDVYRVLCDFMALLCPSAVIVVNESTPDQEWLITRRIAGLDRSLLTRAAELFGVKMVGSGWAMLPEYQEEIRTGQLTRIPGGISELAAREIPQALASAGAKLFGVHDVFTIGIADGEHALGSIRIITRTADAVLPVHIIEAFARHCYSALARIARDEDLKNTTERDRQLLDSMFEGLALHEIVLDEKGGPVDYRFLNVNPAFEAMTGLRAADIIGRSVLEVLPGTEPSWIERYGRVALTGVPTRFEAFSKELGRYYEVTAFSPQKGQFATLVSDITERKLSEAELQASEARLAALFDQAPLGYQSLDESGCFIDVNEAWLELLGYTREEVVGKWFGDFLAPEYRDAFRERFPIFKARGAIHSEFQMLHKDGSRHTIAFEGRVGHNPDGTFKQTHCILSDITEKQRAEAALRESEEKFRRMFEVTPNAMTLQTREGVLLDCNEAFCAYAQKPREEVIGHTTLELGMWPDLDQRASMREMLAREGRVDALEIQLQRPDGVVRDMEFSARALEGGPEPLVLVVSADITERKSAEHALRESEEKYRTIAENIGDVVWILDPQTMRFLYTSPSVEKLRGYTAEEVMDQPIEAALTPGAAPVMEDLIRARLDDYLHGRTAADQVYNEEIEQPCKDGSTVWTELTARIYPDADTGRPMVLGVTRDLSDRKRTEAALREVQERMQAILDNTPSLIYVKDLEGRFTLVNRELEDLFGMTSEELIGKTSHDILDESIADMHWANDLAVIESREPVLTEEVNGESDGRHIYLSVKFPLFGPDGDLQGVCGISTEITASKKTEDELRERNEFIEAVLENAPIGFAVNTIDDGRTVLLSPSFGRIYGLEPGEVEGVGDFFEKVYLDPVFREQIRERILADMASGDAARMHWEDIPLLEHNEETRYVSAIDIPLTAQNLMISTVEDVTDRVRAQQQVAKQTERIQRTLTSVIDIARDIVEERDPYTAGHQLRVSQIAVRIAQDLHMADGEIDDIRMASLIHDVGKVAVPTEILSKPGAVSPMEYELLKSHAEAGQRILTAAHMDEPIPELVYEHHERCDGSGYPRGLNAEQILRGAKVIAVADMVEAMSSHRPYRPALGMDAALEEIERGAGSRYDAEVVNACVSMFRDGGFELT